MFESIIVSDAVEKAYNDKKRIKYLIDEFQKSLNEEQLKQFIVIKSSVEDLSNVLLKA